MSGAPREDDSGDYPLSPAQRSRIRRLSRWEEPSPGEEAGELNIVPYLDIIMNIIVFVIATITVVFMSTLDVNPPSAGGGGRSTRVDTKALNLTAIITGDGIGLKTSSGNIATGCERVGSGITIPKNGDGTHDYAELTKCARRLKSENDRFAEETQVTVTANNNIEYQTIISFMDAIRSDDPDSCTVDPESKAWSGKGCLFPNVNFGVAR
ncbi:MAG: biopolymer transporter ExbD [Myxococcota bacterium]